MTPAFFSSNGFPDRIRRAMSFALFVVGPTLLFLQAACYLALRKMDTGILRKSIKDIVDIRLVEDGIDRLSWRDLSHGLSMARLARQGTRELVLYRIDADAASDAFLRHEHVGGEFYLVLKGKIADESGEYEPGDLVYLEANSVHTPRAIGDTLVLVLWPAGVRLVTEEKEG